MMRSGTYHPRLALLVCAAAACTSPVEMSKSSPLTGAGPFVVSSPAASGPAAVAPSQGSGGSAQVVFISLPPGALPGGTGASIRVQRTGTVVSAALVDGGLDPVAVPAAVGDTISLTVTQATGSALAYTFTVPAAAPPILVRTQPPIHKRDVPLNVRLLVVFSEPIAEASLTAQNFELRSGSGTVPGQLMFANAERTDVMFTPAAGLAATTDYELVLQPDIRDDEGRPFEVTVSIPFTTAQGPVSAPWESRMSLPTLQSDLGTGVVEGVLYAVGGSNGFEAGGMVRAYDPAVFPWTRNDRWRTRASMPTPRSGLGVGVIDGVLYAVGGGGAHGEELATVEAYNPATNTWTTRASMPTARYGVGVGVLDGMLYAVGGMSRGEAVATVEVYDPATNSWTTKARLPTARSWLGIGAVNGVLYAIGGWSVLSPGMTTVEAYHPDTDSWSVMTPMPTARYDLGMGVVNGVVYALGGMNADDGHAVITMEAYDPATNTWSTSDLMPIPLAGFGVGVVQGVLYAIGGFDFYETPSSAVQAYHIPGGQQP